MRTSCALGGATSMSSMTRSSPAPQHTAALQVMVFPAVSDIVVVVGVEGWRISEEKLDRQAIVIVSAPRVLLVIDPGSLLIIHPTVSSSVTMTSVCDSACDRCGRVRLASDVAAGAACGRAWGHLTGQQSTMQ